MINNRSFMIFAAVIFLNFYLINTCFALESKVQKNVYPDYSYEFVGKDKCENFNRKIYIFNSKLNKYVIRPVNVVWASIMPKYAMNRVQNFCNNIEFPVRFTACLLQKDFKSSGKEAVRFLTNTTIGLGGLYDPAKNHFKIESRQEDIEQVLAHYNVKKGPYLALPIIPPSNVRGIIGEVLDCPLNPSSYVFGPVIMIAKAASLVNKTTEMQPLLKMIDYTYADPYDITKKLYGVENYIKNSNLDRQEVLAEKTAAQNIVNINNVSLNPNLKADIELKDFNPQCPVTDAIRTVMFDAPKVNDSIWSEISVWNRCFSKKIKTSYAQIDDSHPKYRYRYILQKNKTAPLAILYPSIGEGVMSHHSIVLAKLFYDEGYSVLIQGSPFQWEFVKSMPDSYRPGYPSQDADYSRMVTSKILANLESKKDCKFDKKILVGTSFGAITTLFVAAKEDQDNTLGISKYISVNPPIELLFALKQIDKISQDWGSNSPDIKLTAAVAAAKALQFSQDISDSNNKKEIESLPFTEDEAKLVSSFVMKQKLSDLVFTIENGSKSKKSDLYRLINDMSFNDYAKKYLLIDKYKSYEHLSYDTSLYPLANFLQKSDKYKIYHSLDDYYVNHEQLIWLKKQSKNKSVFFNYGSHLGFLYRKEFIDEFKKDIKLNDAVLCEQK